VQWEELKIMKPNKIRTCCYDEKDLDFCIDFDGTVQFYHCKCGTCEKEQIIE
jgi:hypothetical protein